MKQLIGLVVFCVGCWIVTQQGRLAPRIGWPILCAGLAILVFA